MLMHRLLGRRAIPAPLAEGVLARRARAGERVPTGALGLVQCGTKTEVWEAGAEIAAAQGKGAWWLSQSPFVLRLTPPGAAPGLALELTLKVNWKHSAPDLLAPLAQWLNALDDTVAQWTVDDLAEALRHVRDPALWPLPCLQTEEAIKRASDAGLWLERTLGFRCGGIERVVAVAAPTRAHEDPPFAEAPAAVARPRLFARQPDPLAGMQRWDDQLVYRLFRELPDQATALRKRPWAPEPTVFERQRAVLRRFEHLAATTNRLPSFSGGIGPASDATRANLLLQATRYACDGLDAAWRWLDEVGGAAADLSPLEQAVERIEVGLKRRRTPLWETLPDTSAFSDNPPAPVGPTSATGAPESTTLGEAQVMAVLPDGAALNLIARQLPIDAGDPGEISSKCAVLSEAVMAARSREPGMVTARLRLVGPREANTDALGFAAILADLMMRGTVPQRLLHCFTVPVRVDWSVAGGALVVADVPAYRDSLRTLLKRPELADAAVFLPLPPDDPESAVLHEAVRARCKHVREICAVSDLQGQTGQAGSWRQATVYFPVVGEDRGQPIAGLDSVTVSVSPVLDGASAVVSLGGAIAVEEARRARILALIAASRGGATAGLRDPLHTRVLFSGDFGGKSFELALVLAERVARGAEFPALGRIIATGAVAVDQAEADADLPWQGGSLGVRHVASVGEKLDLILREAKRGDRVLLPGAWRRRAADLEKRPSQLSKWCEEVQAKKASAAFIDRI